MIYTIGYAGRSVADIIRIANDIDATIFDIRYAARSRFPDWSGGRLASALSARYRHVPEWGNINYRGGPISIADYLTGLRTLREVTTPSVILMCVCRDPEFCHRNVVAKMLRRDGYEVREIDE